MSNEYEEYQCPYSEKCSDYEVSIKCGTHLHVKCEHYVREDTLSKLVNKSLTVKDIIWMVNNDKQL